MFHRHHFWHHHGAEDRDCAPGRKGRGRARRHGRGAAFGFDDPPPPPSPPPPPGGFPFGGFPWSFFRRSGPRVRRGDVRAAILALLAEEARNGYQIMQALEERSRGMWRPSPGSIYPALQQLEDEGLIRAEESGGGTGRVFRLTDRGKKHVEENKDDEAPPWETAGGPGGDELMSLMNLIRQVSMAAGQVAHAGSPAQVKEARKLLAETRRALYGILAETDEDEEV